MVLEENPQLSVGFFFAFSSFVSKLSRNFFFEEFFCSFQSFFCFCFLDGAKNSGAFTELLFCIFFGTCNVGGYFDSNFRVQVDFNLVQTKGLDRLIKNDLGTGNSETSFGNCGRDVACGKADRRRMPDERG